MCMIRFEAGMNRTSGNVKRTELLVFFYIEPLAVRGEVCVYDKV